MALWGTRGMVTAQPKERNPINVSIDREMPMQDIAALWPKLSVRIPDEMHVALKVLAARRHTTVQAIVMAALEPLARKASP